MGIRTNYNHTLYASYTGYITQAVVNTFIPLLFLTFQSTYQIPLDKITLLVTVNFAIQLTVDLLSAKFVDKIGYRICIVAAHLFAAAGLRGNLHVIRLFQQRVGHLAQFLLGVNMIF